MGRRQAFFALFLLLAALGLAAGQNIEEADGADSTPEVESLGEDTFEVAPCIAREYGIYGEVDAAAAAAGAAAAGAASASADGTASVAAVPSTAVEFLADQQCAPLFMPGRLLGIGGMKNCQGSFVPLAPELSPLASNFKTDAMGRFNKSATTLGIFTWPASSSCVDRVTGLPLTYTWQLVSPVYDLLIVTDMMLLTMPASEGLPPLQQGQGEVFDRVYKIFGVDASKLQIDMITYENVTSTSAVWPALMGLNAQLSFISHAAAHTMLVLKQGPAGQQQPPQQPQQQQQELSDVQGIQEAIWSVVNHQAGGNGRELLVNRDLIREVLLLVAKQNNLTKWETSSDRGLEILLDSVARIVAASNRDTLRPITDIAMSCATAALTSMPRVAPECSVNALATSVATVSVLQKVNMTNDILALARAYVNTGDALRTPDNPVARGDNLPPSQTMPPAQTIPVQDTLPPAQIMPPAQLVPGSSSNNPAQIMPPAQTVPSTSDSGKAQSMPPAQVVPGSSSNGGSPQTMPPAQTVPGSSSSDGNSQTIPPAQLVPGSGSSSSDNSAQSMPPAQTVPGSSNSDGSNTQTMPPAQTVPGSGSGPQTVPPAQTVPGSSSSSSGSTPPAQTMPPAVAPGGTKAHQQHQESTGTVSIASFGDADYDRHFDPHNDRHDGTADDQKHAEEPSSRPVRTFAREHPAEQEDKQAHDDTQEVRREHDRNHDHAHDRDHDRGHHGERDGEQHREHEGEHADHNGRERRSDRRARRGQRVRLSRHQDKDEQDAYDHREYDPSSDTHHARRSHKRRWARRGSDPEPHREDPEAHDEDHHEEKEEKEEEYWSPRHKKGRAAKAQRVKAAKQQAARSKPTAAAKLQSIKSKHRCAKHYEPDSCPHDLRPECDYSRYEPGEYPPDSCHPYKTYTQRQAKQSLVSIASTSAAAAQVDEGAWGSVEPDGVEEVPKKRKGILGLLGLLGVLGVVGIIPAGGLLLNSIAPLPLGTLIIVPGLVLAPFTAPLNAEQSKGILPWSFGGNCGPFGGHLPVDKIPGNTPLDVLGSLSNGTCLPEGWLYKIPNLSEAGFSDKLSKFPPGTVVLKDNTIYLPQTASSAVRSIAKSIPGIESTEWTTPNKSAAADAGVKVVESNGKRFVIIRDDKYKRARLASDESSDESSTPAADSTQQPGSTGLGKKQPSLQFHGSAECISQGAPPASCPEAGTLRQAGLLNTAATKAKAPVPLAGAAVAVGYVEGCAGDWYSYHQFDSSAQDVNKLSVDRRFASVFKSFTTGPGAKVKQTWGSFGVANVTGRGHAFLTNTWACADRIPNDASVCVDSWTGVQVKVPLGGLTPYPKDDSSSVKTSNVDVTLSPLSLTTLVDVNASKPVSAAYKAAFETAGTGFDGNAMVADPVRMVKSGRTPLVKQGVMLMVDNARLLNTLTIARALYECRSIPSPQLSNELFVEWAGKLAKQAPMTRPGPLKAALRELCLQGACSDKAAAALLMVNKYLGLIKAKYESLNVTAEVPLSLGDDLLKLAQLAHVGQAQLYDSIRSCCGLTGATSSGPLDDFVQRMDDLAAMAAIKTADIQAAAAMSLGGGVDASSSSAAGGSSSSGGGSATDSLESATTSMVGTLLNNGGIKNCKGILFPLVEGEAPFALRTDNHGQFVVDEPLDGLYKFSSALKNSTCVDSLTGVPVTFPMIQQIPATLSATITAISLMSGPAKSDPAVRDMATVNGQVSSEMLVNYVYRLYGLDADAMDVDFFSFTGQALEMGSPRLAQVTGAISQTMSTYMIGHSLLSTLFGRKASSDQIAQCIVAATYKRITRDGHATVTLTEQASIVSIYKAAFAQCAPPSRRRALLSVTEAPATQGQVAGSSPGGDAYAGIADAFRKDHPDWAENAVEDDLWDRMEAALSGGLPHQDASNFDTSASGAAGAVAATAAAGTGDKSNVNVSGKPADQAVVSVAAASPAVAAQQPGLKVAAAAAPKAAAPAAAAPKAAAAAGGQSNFEDLFLAAARVVAVSNQKIQASVVSADRAANSRNGTFNVKAAMANISAVAAVQQSDLAASVGQLAEAAAVGVEGTDGSDRALDIQKGLMQAQLEELEETYTGDSLADRVAAKAALITPMAVGKGLPNIGQALVVDEDGNIGPMMPTAPKKKAKVSPGIIAGAVVGTLVALGALAAIAAFFVLRRRKAVAAASAPFAPASGAPAFAPDGAAAASAAVTTGGRKLKLIGRRSNGAAAEGGDEGSTPRSTAGPVAEGVVKPCSVGGGGGYGSVLMLSSNPLFGVPPSPVRSPAGTLRDME